MSWAAVIIGGATLVGGAMSSGMFSGGGEGSGSTDSEIMQQLSRTDQLDREKANRQAQEPWYNVGRAGINVLGSNMLGNSLGQTDEMFTPDEFTRNTEFNRNPDFKFTMADLYSDPSYNFRKQEGLDAVNASNAASGLFGSGRGYNALMTRGQDMASQEYQNAYGRASNDFTNNYNRASGEFMNNFNRANTAWGSNFNADLASYNSGVNAKTNAYNRWANLSGLGQTSANQIGQFSLATGQNLANQGLQNSAMNYAVSQNSANQQAGQMQGLNNSLQSGLGTYMNYNQYQNYLNRAYPQQTGAYYTGQGQTGVNYAGADVSGGWY